jgi:hypothetical protein
MDEALKSYLDEMKRELRTDILNGVDERVQKAESRLAAKLDRAAESFAVDVGHLHGEIRAGLDRLKKIDSNVTTGVEMLVRQSRWHDETDTKVLELLVRMDGLEKRLYNLENRA